MPCWNALTNGGMGRRSSAPTDTEWTAALNAVAMRAAERVREKLRELGLTFETWGPQPG